MTDLVLTPAMAAGGDPTVDALWVGLLDTERLVQESGIRLEDAGRHRAARILVRTAGVVRGYVAAEIAADVVDPRRLTESVGALPAPGRSLEDEERAAVPVGRIAVIICTRDRADQLADALRSVLACDGGPDEVVVVDNAPSTSATRELVEGFADPRVRYVLERRAGLGRARNAGVAATSADVVAFTDDDVIVDPLWIRWIAAAFGSAADVRCVSGLVPSGELRNEVQRYFDARVSWSKNVERAEFRMSAPPARLPMFPFCVGEYGTGANFAVRREALLAVGGFDPCLGVGTRTRGGEDIDLFVRMLLAGGALVVEPSAIVWHRHRADLDALLDQAIGYGTGLGAWLTKLALNPRTLGMALRRSPTAFARLLRKPMQSVDADAPTVLSPRLRGIARLELVRVLHGPFALAVERRADRRLAAAAVRSSDRHEEMIA